MIILCSRYRDFVARVLRIGILAAGLLPATGASGDLSDPGPYPAGWRSVTVTRANATSFTARLFYPAAAAGQNAAIVPAGGPFPAISFGHGFLQAVPQYQSTCLHLASHGYIVIASESEGSIAPSHANFASDLSRCLSYLEQENAAPASALYGRVNASALGMSGHSMGGGASVLAAAGDPRVKALITMAAAETTPSAVAAAANLRIPSSFICGSMDTIVPPSSNGQLMFNATASPRQLPTITGGFHCGFVDANFVFCDSGSATRAAQLAATRALLTAFFDLYLKQDQSRWTTVWGPEAPVGSGVTLASDPRISVQPASAAVQVTFGGESIVNVTVTNTGASPTGYTLAAEAIGSDWFASVSPSITGVLLPGGAATVGVAVRAVGPGAATPTTIIVSARSERDQGTRAYAAITATGRVCVADVNRDGLVNVDDVIVFLAAFFDQQPLADVASLGGLSGGDGQYTADDIVTFLAAFFAGCG